MPPPIIVTLAYLAANLAMLVWLERERLHGRTPSNGLTIFANGLRWGPPLAGAVYLIALSGDWAFVLFVLAFFAGAFWLLDGLLAFQTPTKGSDPWRGGDDDRP